MFDTAHPLVHQATLWVFAGLLLWAALGDARDYLIPNRLVVAIAMLYPGHVLASGTAIEWLPALAVGAAVLGGGFILFSRGIIGGGDVKLMSVIAVWAGTAQVVPFLFITSIAGGVLSLATLVSHWHRGSGGGVALVRQPVPYGVAVSAGGMFVALHLLASP